MPPIWKSVLRHWAAIKSREERLRKLPADALCAYVKEYGFRDRNSKIWYARGSFIGPRSLGLLVDEGYFRPAGTLADLERVGVRYPYGEHHLYSAQWFAVDSRKLKVA